MTAMELQVSEHRRWQEPRVPGKHTKLEKRPWQKKDRCPSLKAVDAQGETGQINGIILSLSSAL